LLDRSALGALPAFFAAVRRLMLFLSASRPAP
jgi:hypothetical protein